MECPKRCPNKTKCNKKTGVCVPKTQRQTVMDLAFLFLTYDDIIHSKTKQFIKPYSVYVNAKTPQQILLRKYTVSNLPTEWGQKSIVDATLHLLRTAYAKNHTWYILLAHDSLPLVSSAKLEHVLKYQNRSMFHLLENNELEWKASQWWILNRTDVQTILDNADAYDAYLKENPLRIRGAWDEIYFLSLLKYVNPAYLYQEYKPTYVRWLTKSVQKHPVTYGKLLSTDVEDSRGSFFIRKTTPELTTSVYKPQKTLWIKVWGTQSSPFQVPSNTDLMIISMVPNSEIPMLNQSIHTYFSIYKFLYDTVLEVLSTLPTYLWDTVYMLDEKATTIKGTHGSKQPIRTMGRTTLPNPPQFYEMNGGYQYAPNKIAFLFLTMGDINQSKVWTDYFRNQQNKYTVYINPKYPELVKTDWLQDRIIPKRVENTGWGFITEAYHNLLEEAMKDKDNVKFVFISESCIPLKSFDALYTKMMTDDLRTSYVKFMKPSHYDKQERIATQVGYQKLEPFIKHYARMCLSRYHGEKLLKKDFGFFNSMHVGDEFFLTLIHPSPGQDFVKDFEMTYDNWEDVQKQVYVLNDQIKQCKQNDPRVRCKIAVRDNLRRNPITYTSISTEDITRAMNRESFFWRKFTADPLPWTSDMLNIRTQRV